MNALSNQANMPVAAPESEEVSVSMDTIRARRRRRILVNSIRVLILVVFIGGWQFLTSVGIIDPFFWGQPSGIWNQLVIWVTQGTAQGPLWQQIAVTLEEAIIGFVIGVFFGVIFGVVLGRNRFLADVLSPFIKAANAIPRVTLAPLFVIALGLGIQSKIALAAVLGVFFVFFFPLLVVREGGRHPLANDEVLVA